MKAQGSDRGLDADSHRPPPVSILQRIPDLYKPIPPFVILPALLLSGLFFRLYRLREQSAWIDDFQSVAYLEAPNLHVFMALIRHFNPESVPLYYLLQFAWSGVFGPSLQAARCLSVLLGLVSIALAYHVGRKTLNARLGYFTAGLMAFSPLHIWYSQATRPYPLLILLALASLAAFLHAEEKNSRVCWGIHVIANLLLLWTHLLTAFFIMALGIYVLIAYRRRFRTVAFWGVWHVAATASVLLYMWDMPYVVEAAYAMYLPPGLQRTLTVIAAPDAPVAVFEIVPSLESWRFLPESLGVLLHRLRPYGDYGLIGLGIAAILFSFIACVGKGVFLPVAPIRRKLLLHLLIIVVSGVTLGVLSWVWRPCFMPRYVIYSAPSLYVALGYTLLHFPVRWAKGFGGALLIICYVVQLSVVVPAQTRTNWHAAASLIRESGGAADYVCVGYMPPQTRVLRYHLPPGTPHPKPAFTAHDVVEQALGFFSNRSVNARSVFWAVIQRDYGAVSLEPLERLLGEHGAIYERFDLEALEHLTVYRISDMDADIILGEDYQEGNVWSRMMNDAGIVIEDPDAYARALRTLRRLTDVHHPRGRMVHAVVSILCSLYGCPALAEGFAMSAIRIAPTYALGHFALGGALWRQGKDKEAAQAFELAFIHGDPYIRLYRPYIGAMLRGDTPAALRELAKLDRIYADMAEYVCALLRR